MVEGHDVNLTSGASHSVHWTFDDLDENVGDFTTIEGDNVPWFVSGAGTDAPEYATYQSSGQAALVQEVAGVAQLGAGTMRENLFAQIDANGDVVTRGQSGGNVTAWGGELDYSSLSFDQTGTTLGHDVAVSGFSGGVAVRADSGLAYGFMAGLSQTASTTQSDVMQSFSSDSSGYFGGLAVAADLNGLKVDGGLRFGSQSSDTQRFVNDNLESDGIAVAEGSFDTTWMTVSGRLAYDVAITETASVSPFFAASYTRAQADSYTETGAAASASVDGYAFGVSEYELGVSTSWTVNSGTVVGSLSYFATRVDGDTATVEMIGDTNDIAVGAVEIDAARLGLSYTTEFGNGLGLELGGNVLVGGSGVSGGVMSLSILW